jgi:hypothetical protein
MGFLKAINQFFGILAIISFFAAIACFFFFQELVIWQLKFKPGNFNDFAFLQCPNAFCLKAIA